MLKNAMHALNPIPCVLIGSKEKRVNTVSFVMRLTSIP